MVRNLTNQRFVLMIVVYTLVNSVLCAQEKPEVRIIPEGFELVVSEDKGFSLLKPVDWKSDTRIDEGGKSYFVLSSPVNSGGFEASVSVVTDSTNKTIGQYTNDLLTSYIQLFQTFDLENRDTLTINDILFGSFVLKYDLEGRTYRMRTVYTIHEGRLYHINALAPIERFDGDQEVMDKIIASFVVLW